MNYCKFGSTLSLRIQATVIRVCLYLIWMSASGHVCPTASWEPIRSSRPSAGGQPEGRGRWSEMLEPRRDGSVPESRFECRKTSASALIPGTFMEEPWRQDQVKRWQIYDEVKITWEPTCRSSSFSSRTSRLSETSLFSLLIGLFLISFHFVGAETDPITDVGGTCRPHRRLPHPLQPARFHTYRLGDASSIWFLLPNPPHLTCVLELPSPVLDSFLSIRWTV